MDITVTKWGNSLGVRIPQVLAQEVGLFAGKSARLNVSKGRIVIEPAKYDLKTLVDGITSENCHDLIDMGAPQGKEVW